MERDKTNRAGDTASAEGEANIVESGGETTAAATGPAEIGAATGDTTRESAMPSAPVGAGTMVEVADEPDSAKS